MPLRTTARMTAFSPGQSPPPVSTPIRTAATIGDFVRIEPRDPASRPARGPRRARLRGDRERLPRKRRRGRRAPPDPRARADALHEPADRGSVGRHRQSGRRRAAPGAGGRRLARRSLPPQAGRAVGVQAGGGQLGSGPGGRERRPRRSRPARDRLPGRAQPRRVRRLGPGHQQRRAAPGLAGRRTGQPDRGAAALGGRTGALLPVGAADVPAPRARRPGRGAHDRRPHDGARRGAARADRRHRRLRARAGGRGRRRRAPGGHPDRRHQGPPRRPRHGARCRPRAGRGARRRRGPTRWCWRSPATATRRSCSPG